MTFKSYEHLETPLSNTHDGEFWIATHTGKRYRPGNPRVEDIDIQDIAHALSLICRFNGHTKEFYSVAQHSVLVALQCSPENALEGLLHDAHEAYIGDVATPLKPFLPDFKQLDKINELAIRRKFGLPAEKSPEVKLQDSRAAVTEKRDLLPNSPPWDIDIQPWEAKILPWSPYLSEMAFLAWFKILTKEK